MKKPRNTRRISVISKRSWVASAVFLLLVFLCCCSPSGKQEGPTSGGGAKTTEVDRLKNSWVGLYAQRNTTIAKLLSDGEGWLNFREMSLPDAIKAFSAGNSMVERLGKARASIQMAETFAAMDVFYLKTEADYLSSLEAKGNNKIAGRLGLVRLRQGDIGAAEKIFSGIPPKGQEAVWAIGKAGLGIYTGKGDAGALEKTVREAPAEKVPLAAAAAYSFGRPVTTRDKSPWSSAVASLYGGDLGNAAAALEKADYSASGEEAGPELFLYDLLRTAYAKMALESVKTLGGQEAAWISGRAFWLLRDYGASASALRGVTGDNSDLLLPTLIFGVVIDGREMLEVATVLRGAALIKAGSEAEGTELLKEMLDKEPSAYTLAFLAELQTTLRIKGPLGNPAQTVEESIVSTRMERIKMLEVENGEVASAILGARQAEICRKASSIQRTGGKAREALDLLDSAHQKRKGYKPDFINPPPFLVDLASAYALTGQYAPSTEILFELSNQYPAARLNYESLKRLYASRTGGEAPPR